MTRNGGGARMGTPGPSVRVTTSNGITQVLSSPHAIHRATVQLSRALGRWLVVVETANVQTRDFRNWDDALRHAGTIIGTLYRVDMRSKFTAPQRYAMGQALCPRHVDCEDLAACPIERPDHRHICRGRADFMSIWCVDHNRAGGGGI